MAVRFPNNMLIQVTNTSISTDGKEIIDEEWPQAGLGTDPEFWVTYSVGWEPGSTSGREIETYNCADCVAAYAQHVLIKLTKMG